jgi:serine/threonine protein kinase/lipopolysaccharide biosynthesis regulator YciM
VRTSNKNEEAIFAAAIEIESAAEREGFVKEACRGDLELLDRVESLLKVYYEDKKFLKSPPGVDITVDSPVSEGPGTRIGRYKLLEMIGEGGFGVVYMAQQEEPIRRRVALKIIKLGMDTKQVIARFEAERQALAMMEHPNIAKVLDAGATETGRPYFVMELVRGIPITEYSDKNNLETRQRLELFIDVCKAVHHAHQKGIIHRDIKPTNVLITLRDDGKPVPKIIDFGIAKATQQKLTEKTYFTAFKQFIGTPEYMSPEQAQMGEVDVDTRSDIYSLGVLLYELLTGTTPFDGEKLRSAAYDEMLKTIRETEPLKPSTCLNTLGDALTNVAKHRQVEVGELGKLLRGELDWIVMKTLEKDRTRRYETANELLQDIERHLSDEPVTAGPPSAIYRMKKFVRRNRSLVTSIAAVVVVLMAGIVVSTIFAVGQARARAEAERQAKISQAIADFLENDILASVEPAKAKGPEVTVRYILDAASESLADKFEDEPLVEASIHQTLGNTYISLGKYEAAKQHLERAMQIRREQLGKEHPDTLYSMGNVAVVYHRQDRYDEAEALCVETLELNRRVLGEEHPQTLDAMNLLGHVYMKQGRHDEAEQLLVKALENRRRVLGEEQLRLMNSLAIVYINQGRYDEAEQLHVNVLEIQRRALGEEHPETLVSMYNVAAVYHRQGRYDEAEALCVETLELSRRVLGEEHPETLSAMNVLGHVYMKQGHHDEAEGLLVEILETRRRTLGEEHPNTLDAMVGLIALYDAWGKPEKAEEWRRKLAKHKKEKEAESLEDSKE